MSIISSTDHNEEEYYDQKTCNESGSSGMVSEIEEVLEEHDDHDHRGSNVDVSSDTMINYELFEMKKRFAAMPSIKEEQDKGSCVNSAVEDCVYVAVGKSPSSVSALDWTLRNAVNYSSSTVVYLIHIFPEIKYIPTPLGKLPLSQVSPEQVETFMAQERGKRRELLQKFIIKCSAANVNVDTILIESDGLPKAILDLIDILNIRKLVVGTTKSSLRKLRSRKGTGTADQILKGAPETCEVKIICEGSEVVIDRLAVESPSHRGGDVDSSKEIDNSNKSIIPEQDPNPKVEEDEREFDDKHGRNDTTTSCMCFK